MERRTPNNDTLGGQQGGQKGEQQGGQKGEQQGEQQGEQHGELQIMTPYGGQKKSTRLQPGVLGKRKLPCRVNNERDSQK